MERRPLTERQRQIVEAALHLLATKGSRQFTAGLLAKQLGITGGALYRHFDGMEAIVDAVVDQLGEVLFEGFPPAADDPLERLRLFFEHRARTLLGNPDVSRLLLSDHLARAGSAAQVKRLAGYRRRSQEFVVACLDEAARARTLAEGLGLEAAAVVVLGAILALSHARLRVADRSRGEQLVEEVWSGLERMLRRPPRR